MRILVASDLHFEFHRDGGRSLLASLVDADVLVCAGDLGNSNTVEAALHLVARRYEHVIFVCGNHEFYGGTIPEVRDRISRLAHGLPGLHYLDDATCDVGGVRFVGATMWTREVRGIRRLHRAINDFSLIAGADPEIYDENRRSVAFLADQVREGDVVVTHHLPSEKSVHSRFVGSPLNVFFICDVEALILDRRPRLWVHGHTHSSVDLRVGETRIVCNPFGYVGHETNHAFREDLVIDL